MSVTENYTDSPETDDANVQELDLAGTAVAIPEYTHIPVEDPGQQRIAELGIHGQLVAEIQAGRQVFVIVDISETQQEPENDVFLPFAEDAKVKVNTPRYFRVSPEQPYALIHVRPDGELTARAIREDEPITIGREAEAVDPKSQRFDYDDDAYLSRQHFSVSVEPGTGILLADLDSMNHTQVRFNHPANQQPEVTGSDISEQTDSEADPTNPYGFAEFAPRYEVTCGERTFHISEVIRSSRDFAVMYTDIEVDGKKLTVPRMLYKSQSDGGWRAAYGIDVHGRYMKEVKRGGHYTQETKLHPAILAVLEGSTVVMDEDSRLEDQIEMIFETAGNRNFSSTFTASTEVQYFGDVQVDTGLKLFDELTAGEFDKKYAKPVLARHGLDSMASYLASFDKAFKSLKGFVPNFKKGAQSKTLRQHTTLGQITVEEYPAKLGKHDIVWSMASDGEGRTWVDSIRLADARVTSYGTMTPVINSGLITSKPVEYTGQSDSLKIGEERVDIDMQYSDITPVLANLLPIREYKKSKIKS